MPFCEKLDELQDAHQRQQQQQLLGGHGGPPMSSQRINPAGLKAGTSKLPASAAGSAGRNRRNGRRSRRPTTRRRFRACLPDRPSTSSRRTAPARRTTSESPHGCAKAPPAGPSRSRPRSRALGSSRSRYHRPPSARPSEKPSENTSIRSATTARISTSESPPSIHTRAS